MNPQVEYVCKSLETIKEMLGDRRVSHDPLNRLSAKEVGQMLNEGPTFVIPMSEEYFIVYILLNKAKTEDIASVLTEEMKRVMIITKESLSNQIVKTVAKRFPALDAQYFSLGELQFNISKHELVPRHELITDTDTIKQIMEQHNVKQRTNFPLILRTDPMARYLDAKPGHLVRITRPSTTAGEYISYRCCV